MNDNCTIARQVIYRLDRLYIIDYTGYILVFRAKPFVMRELQQFGLASLNFDLKAFMFLCEETQHPLTHTYTYTNMASYKVCIAFTYINKIF